MRARVKSVDLAGALDAVRSASEAALGIVAENAKSDTKPYVPYDTGALQGSAEIEVSGGSAYIRYGGDSKTARYAREQYYNVHNHEPRHNAIHACDHWGEHSKADNADRWARMYADEMSRRL